MKLKEIIRKKFEIDRFISEGEENKIREKASSLQPEMENFESSTKLRKRSEINTSRPSRTMYTGFASG